MAHLVTAYLPWLLSLITIVLTVLIGNKWRFAWAFGLGGQALWLLWIACSQAWGFLPLTLTLTVLYARNQLKWWREANPRRTEAVTTDKPEWKESLV